MLLEHVRLDRESWRKIAEDATRLLEVMVNRTGKETQPIEKDLSAIDSVRHRLHHVSKELGLHDAN